MSISQRVVNWPKNVVSEWSKLFPIISRLLWQNSSTREGGGGEKRKYFRKDKTFFFLQHFLCEMLQLFISKGHLCLETDLSSFLKVYKKAK